MTSPKTMSASTLGALLLVFSACENAPLTTNADWPAEEEVASATSSLTAAERRARAAQIRDAAALAGITQGWLLGGIADQETRLSHCRSEWAGNACSGPNSPDCGGGPVLAGYYDGPCSIREGGLGLFQFDGGTHSETLARDGEGILLVAGNVRRAVVFVTDMVIRSRYIDGVSTVAEAVEWMNGVRIDNGRWLPWLETVRHYYNGCSSNSTRCRERRDAYGRKTRDIYNEMGAAFWDDVPGATCDPRCEGDTLVRADCTSQDCSVTGLECEASPARCEMPIVEPPEAVAVAGAVPPNVAVDGPTSRLNFVPPHRLFDTREAARSRHLIRRDGSTSGPIDAMSTSVYRSTLIPPGASGVWLNLAVIGTDAPSFMTVFPSGRSRPGTSNVNVPPLGTRANAAPVRIGVYGGIDFYSLSTVHAVADVSGFFGPTGDGLTSIAPLRVLDTREPIAPLAPMEVRRVDVMAPPGSTGVVATIAVIDPAMAGFLQAFPCGTTPETSSINFGGGDVVANTVVVPLVDGEMCVRSTEAADIVVDVGGYLSPEGRLSYQPLFAQRILDTRTEITGFTNRLSRGQILELPIQELNGMPRSVQAVVTNITALASEGPNFVTAFPCGAGRGNTSSLNLDAGDTVGALAVTQIDPALGTLCVFANRRTHLVIDVVGVWIMGDAIVTPGPDAGPGPSRDAGPGMDSGPGGMDRMDGGGITTEDGGVVIGDAGVIVSDGGVVLFADGGPGYVGPGDDAGAGGDVGAGGDAEPGGELPGLTSGCGCNIAAPKSGTPLAFLFLLALTFLRRRKQGQVTGPGPVNPLR